MKLGAVELLAFAAATSAVGTFATAWAVIRMPPDYFARRERTPVRARHPLARVALLVAKNALGSLAVLLGLLMAIPGVPGPGLLTILLGLMVLDFPGKYSAERWLVGLAPVRIAIDRLRARAGCEPLQMPARRAFSPPPMRLR